MTGEKLLPCWHCGGEVSIALHSNEFGEYWWTVQRGHDDATACKCRLFMESDKFCLDVEEGEQAKDSPWAMELRARLVEKWNTRVAVTDHDFAMAVHDGELWGKCSECKERKGYYLDAETIHRQQEHIAKLERENAEALQMLVNQAATIKGQIDGLHARDELMRDLARRIPWSSAFYDGEWHRSPSDEVLAERMRELGIEVES